ncbi:MAG: translocation/assembly module TamB domain-containing protein [Magnetococcus sp. DMHC-1]
MRRFHPFSVRRLAGLLFLILLFWLSGSLLHLLRSPAGMTWLEQQLNQILTRHNIPITLRGLQGSVPFQIRMDRLEITDSQGVWLAAHHLELHWSGMPLWRGVVQIDRARIAELFWYRQPHPEPPNARSPPQNTANTRKDDPGMGPFAALIIQQWAIDRVHLPEPIPGLPTVASPNQPNMFSVQGALHLPLPAADTSSPLPGPSWRLTAHQDRLFTVTAHGTLSSDWLAQTSTFAIDLPDLTPWSSLVHTPLAGTARLVLDSKGLWQQTQVEATLDTHALHLANWQAESVQTRLSSNISLTRETVLPVTLDLQGTTGAWYWAAAPGLPNDPLTFALRLHLPVGAPLQVQNLTLQGSPLQLTGHGHLDPATGVGSGSLVADLTEVTDWLAITTPSQRKTTASGKDTVGPGTRTASSNKIKTPGGRGLLRVDFSLAAGLQKVDIHARLALRELHDWPAAITALAGPTPVMAARLTGEGPQPGTLRLSEARVDGAALTITGNGSLHLPTRQFAMDWQGELPDLRPLARVQGHAVAGRVRVHATLDGHLDNPAVQLDINGEKLLWNRQPMTRLQGKIQGRHLLHKPAGDIHLTALFPGGESRVAAVFQVQEHRLDVSHLTVTAPAGTLQGDLLTNLSNGLTQGKLHGAITNLASLTPLLGVPLTGKGTLQVDLQHMRGEQHLATHLDGQHLAVPWGSARQVTLDGRGEDLWGKPRLQGTLTATEGRRGTHRLEHFQVSAEGSLQHLALNLTARGNLLQPFTLLGSGAVSLTPASRKTPASLAMTLHQLSGQLGDDALRLAAPLHMVQGKETFDLSPVSLSLGTARLKAHLHMDSQAVAGEMHVQTPLAMATRHLDKPWTGVAEGTFHLAGSPQEPHLRGTINLQKLQATNPAWTRIPPLDSQITLNLAEQLLTMTATTTSLSHGSLSANGTLPVHLQLLPFRWEIAPQAELTAALRTDFRLEHLATFLDMPQQELAGRLQGNLRLGGAFWQPRLTGTVQVSEGRYLHLENGTELKNVQLEAQADQQTLTITHLAATSGPEGHIRGTGHLGLAPETHFPLHLDLELTQIRPVNNRIVHTLADGQIRLRGPLLAPRIAGAVTLGQTEIFLANPEPEELDSIAVEEQMQGVPLEQTRVAAERDAPTPTLDLTIFSPGRLFTRGRGIDVEWSGEIKVTGEAANPELRGLLEMRRGQVDLLGQRFQVVRGTLNFTGVQPPNPHADIDATLQRKDLQATLHIQGPLRSPTLSFASDPPLSQDDVISHILFGRNTAAINPTQAASLALALRTLKDGSGRGFLSRFQEAIGINNLDFTPGERPETGVVKVGKYLNDKIFLQVERGLAPGTGGVSVEMDMTPSLSLKTDMHEEKSQEIGVNWKHQY